MLSFAGAAKILTQPCALSFSPCIVTVQIKSESFVEDINNLLNSGEVPNMFPYDERASIGEAVSPPHNPSPYPRHPLPLLLPSSSRPQLNGPPCAPSAAARWASPQTLAQTLIDSMPCVQVRGLAKKMGRTLDTPAELWAFFVERARVNLHLVLCFSPIGSSFRDRLRQFPSLINCCTIDW